MTPASSWVRAEVRRRAAALVLLALVAALVGATVLAAVAGSRRTLTAYERFLQDSGAGHVDAQLTHDLTGRSDADLGQGSTAEEVIAELRAQPFVDVLGLFAILHAAPDGFMPGGDFFTIAPMDDTYMRAMDRAKVVRGRLPRAAEEVALNEEAWTELGVKVGDEIVLHSTTPEQMERLIFAGDMSVTKEPRRGPTVRSRVVGVVRSAVDVGAGGLHGPYAMLSRAGYERYGEGMSQFAPGAAIRLRGGYADVERLQGAIEELTGPESGLSVEDRRIDVDAVDDALRVQAVALLLFAGVASVAGLVALGTSASRQAALSAQDGDVLRALGLTRRQRGQAIGAVLLFPFAIGLLLSLVGALALSPLLPLGVARRAEPNPGLDVDPAVIALGAAGLAAAFLVVAAIVAWRWSRAAAGLERRVPRPWRVRSSPVVAAGVQMALDPGGNPRVPVRQAVAGSLVAVIGVTAVLTFGASLTNLVDNRALSGFPWDAELGGGEDSESIEPLLERATADEDISDLLVARIGYVSVGGRPTQIYGTRVAKGESGLTIVDGRAPAGPDEVAVGPQTLDRLDRGIGDELTIATEEGVEREYNIVGEALFPIIDSADYANGVHLTEEGMEGLQGTGGYYDVLVTFADGVDHEAKKAELEEELGFLFEAEMPAEISNLREAERFPLALAAFLAVLGLAALVHALVTGVRRRRKELAVLRTLGFVRRQTVATVTVQATTLVVLAVVVGLPLGVAAGRWAWTLLADAFYVVARPVVPLSVAAVAPVTLFVAIAAAAWPARRAARLSPAEVLRTE